MSVMAMLCEHIDFDGTPFVTDSGPYRYYWNRYHGKWNDLFSSMQAWAFGHRGHIYAFETIDFEDRFASLNVGGRYSSAWWSYFGDDFNDVVSSSLLIARSAADKETEIPLRSQITSQFNAVFDRKTADLPVSRAGDLQVYGTFFPAWAPKDVFVTLKQELLIRVRIKWTIWNPFGDDFEIVVVLRYRAWVHYHIRFFVRDGSLGAIAHRGGVNVVGPIDGLDTAGAVMDRLLPPLDEAVNDLNAAIQTSLRLFGNGRYADAYLIPGAPPDMNSAGQRGRYDDDVTLVVVEA